MILNRIERKQQNPHDVAPLILLLVFFLSLVYNYYLRYLSLMLVSAIMLFPGDKNCLSAIPHIISTAVKCSARAQYEQI